MKEWKYHPLRDSLSDDDLDRITKVFNDELPEHCCTNEEWAAGLDILFDKIAREIQTHITVLTIH